MNTDTKKILLVDDSKTALLVEQMMLRDGNFDLIMAQDGVEAVEKANSEMPDLILMDYIMPNLDGIEACKQIRANSATQGIPIILVTTRSELENRQRGFQAGANDYVTKPIDSMELREKVRDILGQ